MGQLKLVTVIEQEEHLPWTLVMPLVHVNTIEVLNSNSHYHPMTALLEQEAMKTAMFPVPQE